MEVVTTIAKPRDHRQTLAQVRELRIRPDGKPTSWAAVGHALDLSDRELRSYRWFSACLLKAEHPRMPWKAVARDASVDIPEATLKSHHKSAVLPNGMSWEEYAGAFREAQRARLLALQQAEGVAAAETFYAGVQMLAEVVTGLVADLKDQRDNPPPAFEYGCDKEGNSLYLSCTEQLVLTFPGVEGEETATRTRRTLAWNTKLRQEAEGLARAQKIIGWLLTGSRPEDEEQPEIAADAPGVTAEKVVAKFNQARELVEELKLYEQGVAA